MKSTDDKKIDRRVQRTRKQLHDALIELIAEKGYESITVQNIIDRANFGRSTFYAHFQDKDDLLISGMNSLIHILMDGIEQAENRTAPLLSVRPLFEQAAKQPRLYQAIFGRRGVELVVHELKQHLASHIQEQLEHKQKSSVPADVFGIYLAGALLNLLQWWVDENMPHPPDKMAKLFETMALSGL